jgi:hypothetical protein
MSELTQSLREYAPADDVPLAGYTVAMVTYATVLGLVLFGVVRKTRWQPRPTDVALLGVATHKLSRIVTKDFVTAPLRAPFTQRREPEGAGEVHDEPRGTGLRSSIGYLLTCPYCAGPWLGTGLSALLAWRPRPTRFVLRMLTAVTISDFLHLAYSQLNESRKAVVAERRQTEEARPPRPAARATRQAGSLKTAGSTSGNGRG